MVGYPSSSLTEQKPTWLNDLGSFLGSEDVNPFVFTKQWIYIIYFFKKQIENKVTCLTAVLYN